MTFQATDYDVQTAPTWGVKPSPTSSPTKPSYRGSAPVDRYVFIWAKLSDSPTASPQKSFGSRTAQTANKESEPKSNSTTQTSQEATPKPATQASNTNTSTPVQQSAPKSSGKKNYEWSQFSSEKGNAKNFFQEISKQIAFLHGEESEMTTFWSMFINSISEVTNSL